MAEGLSADRLRAAVSDLVQQVTATTRAEAEVTQTFTTASEQSERTYQQAKAAIEGRFASGKQKVASEYQSRSKKIKTDFDTTFAETKKEGEERLAGILSKAKKNEESAKKALQEAVWLAETVYDATENNPREKFEIARKGVDGRLEDLKKVEDEAVALLTKYRQKGLIEIGGTAVPAVQESAPTSTGGTPVPPASGEDPSKALDDHLTAAREYRDRLKGLVIPKPFEGFYPAIFIVIVISLACGIPLAMHGMSADRTLAISAAGGLIGGIILLLLFHRVAAAQLATILRPMRAATAQARAAAAATLRQAEAVRDVARAQLLERKDVEVREAHERYDPVLVEIAQRREHHVSKIKEEYPQKLEELKTRRDEDLRTLAQQHEEQLATITQQHQREAADLEQRHHIQKQTIQSKFDADWSALESRWKAGVNADYQTINAITRDSAQLFPLWNDQAWQTWLPPNEHATAIRFGEMRVDLAQLPGGIPRDPRLATPGPASLTVPAMLSFPDRCALLIQAGKDGRDQAVQTIQTVMFRLLTALPPGKVRFTIIDPVGLGQNFAGFMHLADYDGQYVTDKIWTEDRHIEQRLLDITEHMENVIQKYLRNEYESIAEYNKHAGEIAEPFRFLVIANFPVNFSEGAARRLASIANSGARCGVYTLITADARQQLPQGVLMSDLERTSVNLVYEKDRFVWKDDEFNKFPLILDVPPGDDFITEKLHVIGEAAKDSSRVEVPFEVIAPPLDEMWSRETNSEVRVALGRAGATKLQYLSLGQGTSQHSLIAGKTGSGKSTLLHAMITNLALWYSPEQVEFYLIDFKKGVEFKTYATHSLPHARAVAIESDREFGLSVLQRLDAELKRRGNIYRDLGVQDLAGYRRATEGNRQSAIGNGKGNASSVPIADSPLPIASLAPIPRTLLIIDEFQELFTEDDKIAQDAALLLDRLVRQGRAFGMHVILGSQTLGGAYTLARSTIGQMGVRIALQCSEADSYLILSDDNAAARLLSRPGEAIYNDASGMVEGNNPFQIVWLPEEKRDVFLSRVTELAKKNHYRPPEPQIVFEGNVPADVDRNRMLSDLLAKPTWGEASATTPATAWLGEPIAIKDPTAAVFRRQAGNNLMIIGQRDEAALAMMAMSMVSLASQFSPAQCTMYVLDGTPTDSPDAGFLAKVAAVLPHSIRVVKWAEIPAAINEIATELKRREEADESDAPGIFLIVHALQRFRMLRQEEDFGFSSSSGGDDPGAPRPEKQFATILREGPVRGIHTLAWVDTANNLTRSLDRSGLREFESRVLFQMGATDSSNLIDSPIAAKLGMHRALFFSEEQGYLEKFRPYALPDERWLAEVGEKLSQRAAASSLAVPLSRPKTK